MGSYDIVDEFFDKQKVIPGWISRQNPTRANIVWEISIDRKDEHIWFTDAEQNVIRKYDRSSDKFEKYNIPGKSEHFTTTYPISLEFDTNDDNMVFFSASYLPSIRFADITEVENGTFNVISEISIPSEEFKGINSISITTSSVVFDEKRNAFWVSVLG